MKSVKRTRDFGEVIRAELAADPELARAVAEERFHSDVARRVYQLRHDAKLTQKQLADLIDTQQSVISRIEDADYDGHSLAMLLRIAFALGKRLSVQFRADSAQMSQKSALPHANGRAPRRARR